MIPTIGVIIGIYTLTRFLEMFFSEGTNWITKLFCVIGFLVTCVALPGLFI